MKKMFYKKKESNDESTTAPKALIYRHGDVLLRRVSTVPTTPTDLDESPVGERTLALGEVTGHSHVIDNGTVYGKNGEVTFLVTEGGTLTHEEHGPIKVEAGAYEVIGQREYQPTGIRRVVD